MAVQDMSGGRKEIEKYVYKERRYDLRTGNGAGNRSDFSDKSKRS